MATPASCSRRISPSASASGASSLSADLGEVGAEQPVFEHFVDVAGHAGHAHAAQRLDARLLERVEGGARLGLGRGALAVGCRVVAGEPHGHGVALAAGNGDVARGRQARQVGEPRLVGGQHRPVGREADLEFGLPAMARTVAPTADLNAAVVSGLFGFGAAAAPSA